jgi:hypothetical protein
LSITFTNPPLRGPGEFCGGVIILESPDREPRQKIVRPPGTAGDRHCHAVGR